MTYEEFTALAKREISTTEYHEVVEPVYTYHPAIPNKETAAKLYDLCGLQVFRDMLNQFEPKLGNAVSHIFEPSYEYTRAYREFKKEVARLGCC